MFGLSIPKERRQIVAVIVSGLFCLGLIAALVVLTIASFEGWISPYAWLYLLAALLSLCVIACVALGLYNIRLRRIKYTKLVSEELVEEEPPIDLSVD